VELTIIIVTEMSERKQEKPRIPKFANEDALA
jgi:hypothetical protein